MLEMTTLPAVIIDQVGPLPALPAADIDRAAAFARQDKAPATGKAYDFASFQAFCLSRGVASLPATPETVAAYLAREAETGLKPYHAKTCAKKMQRDRGTAYVTMGALGHEPQSPQVLKLFLHLGDFTDIKAIRCLFFATDEQFWLSRSCDFGMKMSILRPCDERQGLFQMNRGRSMRKLLLSAVATMFVARPASANLGHKL